MNKKEKNPDYAKNSTWNFLHAYKDAHSQKLIGECPVDGDQAISIFKSQCSNLAFYDQRRYNIMFQKVVDKGGE